LLRLEWIIHPRLVKVKGTLGNALFAIPVGIHTGVSPMKHLEELVLRLVVGTGIADSGNRQLRVLDAVGFGGTFAQGSSVGSNDCRVSLQKFTEQSFIDETEMVSHIIHSYTTHETKIVRILDTYKIRVDSIETRGIRNRHINRIAPCHGLADLHLLIFCRVP
jgi:hypothetical protein